MDYFQKINKLMLNNKHHEYPCKSIIVIGGGRWGKIMSKSLLSFAFVDRVVLISNKNYVNVNIWYKNEIKSNPLLKDKLVVSDNLNKYLNNNNYSVAIIANSPYLHYDTSKLLLENQKHVLVEKPFVKHSVYASELISLAKKNHLTLAVGHEFYFVSYLYDFKNVLVNKLQKIRSIKIIWNDVFEEYRHGEFKTQDMTVNSLIDIYPHIYTIIDIINSVLENNNNINNYTYNSISSLFFYKFTFNWQLKCR